MSRDINNEYLESLKDIPSIDEKTKLKIISARTCAREIIDHIDFEYINSLEDIKQIVDNQIMITESLQ